MASKNNKHNHGSVSSGLKKDDSGFGSVKPYIAQRRLLRRIMSQIDMDKYIDWARARQHIKQVKRMYQDVGDNITDHEIIRVEMEIKMDLCDGDDIVRLYQNFDYIGIENVVREICGKHNFGEY